MATRREHYKAAEQILEEGQRELLVIRALKAERDLLPSGNEAADHFVSLTRQMNEAGKKAVGCWTQALAHATLATADPVVADG